MTSRTISIFRKNLNSPLKVLFTCLLWVILPVAMAQENPELTNTQIVEQINKIVQNTNWTNEAEAAAASARLEQLSKLLGQSPENDPLPSEGGTPRDSLKPPEGMENTDPATLYKMALDAYDAQAGDEKNLSIDLGAPVREEIIGEYEEEQKDSYVMTPADLPQLVVVDFAEESSVSELMALKNASHVKDLVFLYGRYADALPMEQLLNAASALPLKTLVVSGFAAARPNTEQANSLTFPLFPSLEVLYWINNGGREINPLLPSMPGVREVYWGNYPGAALEKTLGGLKKLEILGYSGTQLTPQQHQYLKTQFPTCKLLIK